MKKSTVKAFFMIPFSLVYSAINLIHKMIYDYVSQRYRYFNIHDFTQTFALMNSVFTKKYANVCVYGEFLKVNTPVWPPPSRAMTGVPQPIAVTADVCTKGHAVLTSDALHLFQLVLILSRAGCTLLCLAFVLSIFFQYTALSVGVAAVSSQPCIFFYYVLRVLQNPMVPAFLVKPFP